MNALCDHVVGDDQLPADGRRDHCRVIKQISCAGVLNDPAQSRDEGGFVGHTSETTAKPPISRMTNKVPSKLTRFSTKD